MSAQSVKSFADIFGFSNEGVSAIAAHLCDYAETGELTVLKKTNQVITFSYQNKVRCKFGSVETAKEQVVFIPGDGYVSTIVVAKKGLQAEDCATQQNQENTMSQAEKDNVQNILNKCEAVDAEIKTVASKETTGPLIGKLAKAATYLSAATAIGFVGYYAWKKFGNKSE